MRMQLRVWILVLVAVVLGGSAVAHAAGTVDIGFFYNSLAPYGQWMAHARYGTVWRPAGVEPGWRPYTHGHWRMANGERSWVSDYPWGWAPFHYGRWYADPVLGWVWVPGNAWAPAWVAWRSGGGYVGWAPLPPEDAMDGDSAYGEPDYPGEVPGYYAGDDWAPAASCWSFVVAGDFYSAQLGGYLLPAYRNPWLIGTTVNVTHYAWVDHHVVDRSYYDGRGGRPAHWRDDGRWARDDGRRTTQPVRLPVHQQTWAAPMRSAPVRSAPARPAPMIGTQRAYREPSHGRSEPRPAPPARGGEHPRTEHPRAAPEGGRGARTSRAV